MSLRVLLAGYNVDADALREIRDVLTSIQREADPHLLDGLSDLELRRILSELHRVASELLSARALTPEVLSAAYARISRDPKSVAELRRAAREGIVAARKSNEAIIFGMGHASVAEHAVFNLDILGLSRLAAEELQVHRLLSFTEKSQRYVTACDDYVLPDEICGTEWESPFREEVDRLFEGYHHFLTKLHQRIIAKEGEPQERAARHEQETRAKEDARYLLPLATTTQMGMTLNARNLEDLVRDCAGHELQEMQLLARKLCATVRPLTPSLVKYVQASEFPRMNRQEIRASFASKDSSKNWEILGGPEARLLSATPDGEKVVAEAFASQGGNHLGTELNTEDLWREIFRGMKEHDSAPREFELATVQFQVRLSASCFAQLKRHRMMTLLPAPYQANGGAILPPAVVETGWSEPFAEMLRHAALFRNRLDEANSLAARYLVTNASVRSAIIHVNARELYHMARLRQDQHAQWEIRQLVGQMIAQVRALWPNLMMLACGKDEFVNRYHRIFGGGT
jgi:flavin-dependent thymidylate synthase